MEKSTEYCSAFNLDASETVAYNHPLFPAYVQYGLLSRYPDYSAVSHWHEDLEFIFVKKGKMSYSVNGEIIELCEGSGIMVNSRQIHYGFSEKHKECAFICMLLLPELLQGNRWFYHHYVENITENAAFPYLYLTSDGWQADILKETEKMYYFWENSHAFTNGILYFEVMETFCTILKKIYENVPIPQQHMQKESSEINSLKSMISYVEEHFREHMALDEIALAGSCCKSRCSSLFKKYLRETPVSYITKLRLRKSLVALLESDESITDIAYEYGFGGASYYCEVFRKYYGVSPLKYKKKQRPDSEISGALPLHH